MRKLNDTELYKMHLSSSQKSQIQQAIAMKLNQGVGVIVPQNLTAELSALKVKIKASSYPLLNDALSLYEQFNGRIKLFSIPPTSGGRSPIPTFMPFLFGAVRNKQLESESGDRPVSPSILMNMSKIGRWSKDESQYLGVSPNTDLYAVLQSGYINYKLVYEERHEKAFANKVVLENLTNIYTTLFSNAMIKTAQTYGDEFNIDAARFIIAKFFLRYIMTRPETSSIEDFAYRSIKYRSSSNALKSFEENSDIDYSTLTKFLETFGDTFFNQKVSIAKFQMSWAKMYGEGMLLAIEYVPYLIHFLIASIQGAMLGGASRLGMRFNDLRNDGLIKFYNALVSELR